MYSDWVSPSPQTLRYAYEFAGAEQLLFTSDHPCIGLSAIIETFKQLPLTEEMSQIELQPNQVVFTYNTVWQDAQSQPVLNDGE